MKKDEPIKIELPGPENLKALGGGEVEAWNDRIMRLVLSAIPVGDKEDRGKVGTAVFSGMLDIKSADPIEGMLVSQLVVAHEASLSMYRRAWSQPPEHFEARCRYLQLADKTQRTVVMLTERLDHHRGRGQQQITVKHVAVNADQAIVGNINHTGGGSILKAKDQPYAIATALEAAMPGANPTREPVPISSNEERPVPDAWRDVTGRTKAK